MISIDEKRTAGKHLDGVNNCNETIFKIWKPVGGVMCEYW